MPEEPTPREEPTPVEEARTDSFDLEHSERVRVGVTRGETDLEIGPPRDYPDRADVSVRPESTGGDRVVLSIDAMAGDHGTGHADVELTPTEARTLRDRLDETVRWIAEDGTSSDTGLEAGDDTHLDAGDGTDLEAGDDTDSVPR